ncbi:MAG TPA: pilus assembly protein TadG-related protein, partial [Novosphingobium sp.]|nr:pilus assembly protein TadG-related protein [Novosphingobium sp.]
IAAFALPALLGMGAMAFDISRGLSQRVTNQTVADSAALSAAVAYTAASQSSSVLNPTAQDVAVANGLASSTTSAALVSNYPTSGSTAVQVTVTTAVPISIARAIGMGASYNVVTTAYAALSSGNSFSPCLLALSSASTALSTSGGATISASSCDVAAVGGIDNEGSGITGSQIVSAAGSVTNNYGSLSANLLQYATTFTNPSWNTAIPASSKIVKGTTTLTDPWNSVSALTTDRALIGTYTSPQTISNPTTSSASDWNLNYSPSSNVSAYQTAAYSGKYVIPKGTYNIGALNISGGVTVAFTSGSVININGGLNNSGSSLSFGDSTVTVNGGFVTGSSGFTMGNGNLTIGSGTVTFSGTNTVGAGTVTINAATTLSGGATLTLGAGHHSFASINVAGGSWLNMGAGDLDVTQSVTVGGSSTVATGAGAVRIGKDSSSYSINLSGSGVFICGDGTFSTAGNIVTAGGSRLVIGSTTAHYINGNMAIAGSVLFGTGAYIVNGNFTNGTGGTTWPYTSSVTGTTYGSTLQGYSTSGYDMAGVYVSFILAGTLNLAGGAKTFLIAPTSTTSGGGIQDLLVDSQTSSATTWAAGSTNTFVGSVHLPNSAVTMSGGSTTNSSGQCFMLIANTIAVTGGAAVGSMCSSVGAIYSSSSSSTTIQLVG